MSTTSPRTYADVVNGCRIRCVTPATPAASSPVDRALSHTTSPLAVDVSNRHSPQPPIAVSADYSTITDDVDDFVDAAAEASVLSDTSASINDAVSANSAAGNARASAAIHNSNRKPHSNVNKAPARRTQSADAVSKKQEVPLSARSRSSSSQAAPRIIPFNTATLSAAAKRALVRRANSSSSSVAGSASRGIKRRNTADSPAARKRVHVEDMTFASDDEPMTPTRHTPTARTPITSVRTDSGGGAMIAIRSARTPQSLNNRLTSVTVDSNSIRINVAGDPAVATETNSTPPQTAPRLSQDGIDEQRSFHEKIVEDAKKKRTQHMSDEFFHHLTRFIRDPNYINNKEVSDAMRMKLTRHNKYHRYGFMVRETIDDDGDKKLVSVLVEHPTTKLQRKRNVYATSEPLQVIPFSDIEKTLRSVHINLLNHAGQDATWRTTTSLYTNIPREWCREYCARCRVCAIRARKVHKTPLNPIVTKHIMNKIVIDTIDLSHCAVNGFRYIFYAVDHFSKFHWALVTQTKEAVHAVRLFQIIFSSIGPSKFVQCDNGKEFRNRMLQAYLTSWNSKLIFSRVRHPQTNGAIERANGHLKVQIHKWREEHAGKDNDWPSAVYMLVHSINCTRHTTTKHIPYEIIYTRRSLFFSLRLSSSDDSSQNPIDDDGDDGEVVDVDGNNEIDEADRDDSKQTLPQSDDNIRNDVHDINMNHTDLDDLNDVDNDEIYDTIDLDDATNDNNININNHNTNNDHIIINNGEDPYAFHHDDDDESKVATSRVHNGEMEPADIGSGDEIIAAAVQPDEHLGDLNINCFGPLGRRCAALLHARGIIFVRWGCFGRGLCSICALYTAFHNRAVAPVHARALRSQMRTDVINLGAEWYNECCPVGSLPYQTFIADLNTAGESMGMELFYVASRLLQVNIYVVHVMVETEHEFIQHGQKTPITKEAVSVVVELANKDVQLVFAQTIAIYHRHRTTITRSPSLPKPEHFEGGHYEALALAPTNSPSPWPTNHSATEQLEAARRNTATYANTVHAAARMKAIYDKGRKVKIFKVGDVVVVAVPAKLRKKSNAALNFPAVIVDVQPVADGRDRRYRVMTTKGVMTNTLSAEDMVQRRAHSYPELTSLNIDDWQLKPTISMQQAYADVNIVTATSHGRVHNIPPSNNQRTTTTTTNDTSETSSSSSSDDDTSDTSDSDANTRTPDTTHTTPATQTTPSTGTSALSSSSAASIIRPLFIIKANKPTSKQRRYQVAWGTDPSQPHIVMSRSWESADWFGRYADRLPLLDAFQLSEDSS